MAAFGLAKAAAGSNVIAFALLTLGLGLAASAIANGIATLNAFTSCTWSIKWRGSSGWLGKKPGIGAIGATGAGATTNGGTGGGGSGGNGAGAKLDGAFGMAVDPVGSPASAKSTHHCPGYTEMKTMEDPLLLLQSTEEV